MHRVIQVGTRFTVSDRPTAPIFDTDMEALTWLVEHIRQWEIDPLEWQRFHDAHAEPAVPAEQMSHPTL